MMITLLCAGDLYSEINHLMRIRALNAATVLADKLYGATDKLSVERDITLSILAARDADTIDELRPRLSDSRREADAALAASISGLRGYKFQDLTGLREKIEQRLRGIGDLRQAIDAAVQTPRAARDPELTARWSNETTLLIEDAQLLWTNFLAHFVDVDAVATQHLQYKQFLRVVIDYTGRERSLIGRLIADDGRRHGGGKRRNCCAIVAWWTPGGTEAGRSPSNRVCWGRSAPSTTMRKAIISRCAGWSKICFTRRRCTPRAVSHWRRALV